MSRALYLLPVALIACSIGLEPYAPGDDTDIDVGGPDDTGIGEPIDTGDTDDSAVDANEAPVADAGDDQAVMAGVIVNLDGSGSIDPNGDALVFAWVMTARPADSGASLLDADDPLPRFYADVAGTFTITLTVDDGEIQASDAVDVIVEAPDEPPVADAGADQIVVQGDDVQLNGTASYDPEGEVIAFSWQIVTRPSGSSASLTDAATPYPWFSADAAGEYTVELVVDDGVNDSAPDQVRIVAEPSTGGDTGGDCGASCGAIVRQQLRDRLSAGDLASGPGLALIAVGLFVRRRRRAR